MKINKDKLMISTTKFQQLKQDLRRNFYNPQTSPHAGVSETEARLSSIENCLEKLLDILDEAIIDDDDDNK